MFYGKQGGSRPVGNSDFAVDMLQMGTDGAFADKKGLRRLSPAQAPGHEAEDLYFSVGQPRGPLLPACPRLRWLGPSLKRWGIENNHRTLEVALTVG